MIVDIGGSLNIPLGDSLAARFSVSDIDRDGYAKNVTTGSDLGIVDKTAWRAQFLYTPTDSTDVRLVVDGSESEMNVLIGETLTPIGDGVPYTFFHTMTLIVEKDGEGVALTIEHEFDSGFTLTSITSWRENNVDVVRDVDFHCLPISWIRIMSRVRKIYPRKSGLHPQSGSKFDYVAGLYYFDQKFLNDEFFDAGPGLAGAAECR